MHTIENSQGTLQSLLDEVKDQASRTQDYISSTNNFQLKTEETPEGSENVSTLVVERDRGVPTTALRANDVAFGQIAAQTGIDVKRPNVFNSPTRMCWITRSIVSGIRNPQIECCVRSTGITAPVYSGRSFRRSLRRSIPFTF